MFNSKENKPDGFKDAETIIGESIKVKGNFNGIGDVIIYGLLEGSMKTKGNIFVGEKAKISANLEAKEIVTYGDIKGNLIVREYLSVGETAKIIGDVECSQISVAKGGMINGHCLMSKNVATSDKYQEKEEIDPLKK